MALEFACAPFTSEEQIQAFACPCKLDVVKDLIGQDGIDEILDQASDIVSVATGMRVTGRCTTTVRPCSDGVCGCTGWCSCCDFDGIALWGADIDVVQVKIDGAIEDPSLYRLVDGRYLVRTDRRTWPGYQDVTKADTEVGTYSVKFSHGRLPYVATMAATEVACDLLSGIDPEGQTRLPREAILATLDGMTLQLDPERLQAFPWMQRLFGLYPPGPQPLIYSPEVRGRYTLHVTS